MQQRVWRVMLHAIHTFLMVWLVLGAGTHPLIAAIYHVNPSTGSDSRSAEEAQDPSTPWKTLTHATRASLAAGDVVQLAPGRYDTSSGESFPIALPAGVAVKGGGAQTTSIVAPAGTSVLTHHAPLGEGSWLGDVSLDSDAPDPDPAAGLRIDAGLGVSAPTLDGVLFGGNLSAGIDINHSDTGPGGFAGTVQNSTFSSYDGIHADLSSLSSDFGFSPRLIDNHFAVANNAIDVGYRYSVGQYSVDAELTGNRFDDGYLGAYFYGYELIQGPSCHLLVSGNTFTGTTYPIDISLSYISQSETDTVRVDFTAEGNTFQYNNEPIFGDFYGIDGGSLDFGWTIANNTFSSTDGRGINLSFSQFSDVSLNTEFDIRDNSFRNIGGYYDEAIYIYQYSITADTFDTEYTISGNTFDGITDGAIELSMSNLWPAVASVRGDIRDNQVRDSEYGIYWWLYGVSGADMDVQLTVANNTIEGTGSDAISLFHSSFSSANVTSRIDLLDNTVEDASGGVVLEERRQFYGSYDSSVTVAGNTFSGLGDALELTQSSWSGLASGKSDTRILDNEVRGSGQNGIEVSQEDFMFNSSLNTALTIAGNTVSSSSSTGIYFSLSSVYSNSLLQQQVTVMNNTVSGSGDHGIQLSLYSMSSNLSGGIDVLVAGNTVSGGGWDGIFVDVSSIYGVMPDLALTVAGNTATGSDEVGIRVELSSLAGFSARVARVADNVVTGNSTGLALSLWDYGEDPFLSVSGNKVTNNFDTGVTLEGGFELLAPADFGGGPLGSPGRNIIRDNDELDFAVSDYSSFTKVFARGNFWGTTDLELIDGRIYDDEEGAPAEVDFADPLETEPVAAASATLVATVVEDGGLSGPSPGDTLRYTATLAATGERGCAAALFSAPLPAGATLVSGSVDVSRGILLHGDDDGVRIGLGWLAAGETVKLEWDVVSKSDASCAATPVQGTFTCDPVGLIPTDDPTTDAVGDATAIDWASSTWYADADADGYGAAASSKRVCLPGAPEGYVADSTDCDDHDDDIHPGATEVCDGEDNDCDGTPDDGTLTTFYRDSDGDGYGVSGDTLEACAAPAGYVETAGDCADDDPAVSPGAAEVCDGTDNDCDAETDEEVTSTFYRDSDSDGHGDGSDTTTGCEAPAGYVASSDDCDDSDAHRYPGAGDVCDGVDNDCDRQIDEEGSITWYADTDQDSYGDPRATALGCETAPAGYVANAEDCDDSDVHVNPGESEVCDEKDNDCDSDTDEGVEQFWFEDSDGDDYGAASEVVTACEKPAGYADNAEDCDDGDAEVNPEAGEVCDGIDNDCDGDTDADAEAVWFVDADSDGHGSAGETVIACEKPEGYVSTGDDCADDSAAVNPAAEEVCDEIDNNCDGVVDDVDGCGPDEVSPTPGEIEGGGCSCDTRTGGGLPGTGSAVTLALALAALRRRVRR